MYECNQQLMNAWISECQQFGILAAILAALLLKKLHYSLYSSSNRHVAIFTYSYLKFHTLVNSRLLTLSWKSWKNLTFFVKIFAESSLTWDAHGLNVNTAPNGLTNIYEFSHLFKNRKRIKNNNNLNFLYVNSISKTPCKLKHIWP